MLSFSSLSQEKDIDKNEIRYRLTSTQVKIEKLDEKLILANQRIASLPEGSEVDPSVFKGLEDLKNERKKLSNIAYSLEMYLKGNSDVSSEVKIITKEEFDKYPELNQQQILARPERYLVIGL
jgi:hypothetical protein